MKKIILYVLFPIFLGCSKPNVKNINQEINIDGYYDKISTYEWIYKHVCLKCSDYIKNRGDITGHCSDYCKESGKCDGTC